MRAAVKADLGDKMLGTCSALAAGPERKTSYLVCRGGRAQLHKVNNMELNSGIDLQAR
jgi:hypothetical protein